MVIDAENSNETSPNKVHVIPSSSSTAKQVADKKGEKSENETKTELKSFPVIITDHTNETPKSSDSGKGTNETL